MSNSIFLQMVCVLHHVSSWFINNIMQKKYDRSHWVKSEPMVSLEMAQPKPHRLQVLSDSEYEQSLH